MKPDITYMVKITSTGPQPATAVRLTTPPPKKTQFRKAPASDAACSIAGRKKVITRNVGEIPAGDDRTVRIVLRATGPATSSSW